MYANSRRSTPIAWFCLVLFLTELIFPNVALALTAGPSQPEVQSFEPVGTTEMVNLFSGDFTYNIPLFEVPGPEGGYPVNLFYNSVTSMDEEATWTGLGWNINIGSLGRMMRGVPDDFSGKEKIQRKLYMKPQTRVSAGGHVRFEALGFDPSFGVALDFTYDSYRGVGFSLGGDVSLGLGDAKENSDYQSRVSMGLNLSTLEGASANAGYSISGHGKGKHGKGSVTNNYNVGLSFSGREGLTGISLGIKNRVAQVNNLSIPLSFGSSSYTPSVSYPWKGSGLSGNFSFSPGVSAFYVPFGIRGSFSTQEIDGAGQWRSASAYGYNHLGKVRGQRFIMDFNRANENTIHYNTRFLHTPSTTYDLYNVMGQGVGGMYRAHRSEFGALYDAYLESGTDNGSFGIEAGPATEVGLDMNKTVSSQRSGPWIKDEVYQYGNSPTGDYNYEPFYYKAAGDLASEGTNAYTYMGGDAPLRVQQKGYNYKVDLEDSYGQTAVALNSSSTTQNDRIGRKPRSMSIQPIQNDQLLDEQGAVLLNEYDIKYYTTPNSYLNNAPSASVARPTNKQNAGFTVLGNNGVRWVYGLPIMNHQHREVLASTNVHDPAQCRKTVAIETDQGNTTGDETTTIKHKYHLTNHYLDEKSIPPYAHAYMLTSVVGTDYADTDGIPGPSDGDVGYWMKANYWKATNDYQWRAPFYGANYMEGQKNLPDDNTVSFMWGKRENYLPATLETKTHIAHFFVSSRDDARGAAAYIQNGTGQQGARSYKLDKIELYSKQALKEAQASGRSAQPLKTVHFEYNYELCPGVENNATTNGGKLTLKKVYFTYEGSTRGALSPYQFDYGGDPSAYAYDYMSVDRWGAYRPSSGNACKDIDVPYVQQSDKEQLDEHIAAWHLKKITTPSGATINLELERDDYAYVQDKVATEMVKMEYVDVNPVTKSSKVYFKIDPSVTTQTKLNQYIEDLPIMRSPFADNLAYPVNGEDDLRQIYLKARVNLTSRISPFNEPTFEDVPVYAFIQKDNQGREIHFADPNNPSAGAYIELQPAMMKGQLSDPIATFARIHLQERQPQRIYGMDLGGRTGEDAITSLFAAITSFDAILKGYYVFAEENQFGREIDYNYSFVKLNTIDKIKYGGDIRVKQVTLEDQWNTNETSTIGVTYEYTTTDEEGNTISSGVVENEPSIGYDACALQYADVFYEWNVLGQNDNIHVDLLPLNRSYYPGAKVGYSQVTVRSIASNIAKQAAEGNGTITANSDLAEGFSKTGQTVHEFYTCKDFPIITSSTSLSRSATAPWLSQVLSTVMSLLPITITDQKYTGTQGYSIEQNDMHGKPKKVATYAQKQSGLINTEPLTSVEYVYHASERVKTGYQTRDQTKVYGLNNEVTVLVDDQPSTGAMTKKRLIGVEQEFFLDSRENISEANGGGIDFNNNMIWPVPPIIAPIPIPRVSMAKYTTRTAVTNKIIKRHGLLKATIAYDGQSKIVTRNLVYHPKTGQPVLTSVDNQLGGNIYNYSIPASLAHTTMGAAAENWGSRLKGTLTGTACGNGYYTFTSLSSLPYKLIPGDEFIVTETITTPQGPADKKLRAVYMGNIPDLNGQLSDQFDIVNRDGHTTSLSTRTGAQVELLNVRSGNRNLLTASIAQYSSVDTDALPKTKDGDPLENRQTTNCTAQVVDFVEKTIDGVLAVEISPTNGPVVPYQTIDNVLSASANAYQDHWSMEANYICQPSSLLVNPYLRGEKGVWRMQSSFAYVDDRKQVATSTAVDIKQSGVVDQVPLFNWNHPFYEYCQSKWVRTEDITQYNRDGNPVEARDVIGNYQAEIYGKSDNLVIAKGSNAQYYELGYEGFEEVNYRPTATQNTLQGIADRGYYSEGHLNFFPHGRNCQTIARRATNYRLSYPTRFDNNKIGYVLVRQSYQTASENDPNRGLEYIDLALTDVLGKQQMVRVPASQAQPLPLALGGHRFQIPGLGIVLDNDTKFDFTVYKIDLNNTFCTPDWSSAGWLTGTATLNYRENLLKDKEIHDRNAPLCATVVKDQAHTGNYALKLFHRGNKESSPCSKLEFPQRTLKLQVGEEYIVSFWMSKYSDPANPIGDKGFDFNQNASFEIRMGNQLLRPAGPVINGWQKVEQKFEYTGNPLDKTLFFVNNSRNIEPILIDDVRIFPADGHVQTYVYDPVDYKLQATLDDNNYATFYIYNPEGDLVAVKRETERGIKTIQESRNFIKPTNP